MTKSVLAGRTPIIKKGAHQINLGKLDRASDAAINHFLAPDNFNPYFEVEVSAAKGSASSVKKS